jgi:hypothetical protein
MKYLKIAGLCFASMLVLGMALAGNASAAPLWLLCLEGTGLTKYSNDQCTTAETGGKFQSEGLPSGGTATVRLLNFTLILTDLAAGPLKEKSTVVCDGAGSRGAGIIEGTNKDIIRAAELENAKTNCARTEGSCKAGEVEKVQGVDLPWKTELYETESKARTKILSDGSGEPGWSITCNTVLGSKTDECTSESGSPFELGLSNKVSSLVLLVLYITFNILRGACTQGGVGAFRASVEGAFLLLTGIGYSFTK